MQLVEIYRELDPNLLSEDAVAYLEAYEASSIHVLHNQPRDLGWTQEVAGATVAFLLVDTDDNILARYEVAKFPSLTEAMLAAETAAASATVKLDILVERGDGADDEVFAVDGNRTPGPAFA